MPPPETLSFTIPGITPPSVNHAWRHSVVAGHLHTYKTAEARKFAATVAAIAQGRTITPADPKARDKARYVISVVCVLGKGVRLDADNPLKVTLDALKDAGVIHSDAHVYEVACRIEKCDRANPRTEITCVRL